MIAIIDYDIVNIAAVDNMFRQLVDDGYACLALHGGMDQTDRDFTIADYKNKTKLRAFKDPKPAREVSLIYPKNELKIHIINALRDVISGVVRGAIAFSDVEIISPKPIK